MCVIADKMSLPLSYVMHEMSLTEYQTMLNYYVLQAEKEKKYMDEAKAKKSKGVKLTPKSEKATFGRKPRG